MEQRDAVIVGAGPAGSTCAWKLRQAGLDVLVLDRQPFPRDKTCAGWITPEVLEALEIIPEHYGAHRVIEPIVGFRVGVIGGRAVDLFYDRPVSYGIRRPEFDQFLIERSGAEFRPATHVASLLRDGAVWILDGQISSPMVVGAGGHFCPVARMLNPHAGVEAVVATREAEVEVDPGGAWPARAGVPEFYFAPDFKGYGWVFRKGRYVTVGLGRRDLHGLPDHLQRFLQFLRATGRLPDVGSATWRGHAYLLYGSSLRRTVVDGVLLAGDAAGCAYPRSGEGILAAVESGLLAADTIVRASGDYRSDRLDSYRRGIEGLFGPPKPSRGLLRAVPESLAHRVGRHLVGLPWFARHVVLERWFLHQ